MIAGLQSGAKLTGEIRSPVGGGRIISAVCCHQHRACDGSRCFRRIFHQQPDLLQRFFPSGVLVGTSAALLRSLLFNGILPRPSEEVLDDDGASARFSLIRKHLHVWELRAMMAFGRLAISEPGFRCAGGALCSKRVLSGKPAHKEKTGAGRWVHQRPWAWRAVLDGFRPHARSGRSAGGFQAWPVQGPGR